MSAPPVVAPAFGVDIVDLANPRTLGRHHDRRFMERVFAPGERSSIEAARDPRIQAWRFWAAKEAAFKAIGIHVHPDPPPPFEHAAFRVVAAGVGADGDAADRGTVRWQDAACSVSFREDPERRWVGALAVLVDEASDRGAESGVAWTASDIEETSVRLGARDRDALVGRLGPREVSAARGFAHALVRLAARTEVARRMGTDPGRLEIVNAPGPAGRTPPIVHLDEEPCAEARVSLSHDGVRIAWATWTSGTPH